jgi:hypothetical protein
MTSELLEKLAALEHWQWASWTRYFLQGKHTPEDLHRWIKQMDMKYEDLSEKEKDNDRFWARKVLEIINNGK